MAWHHIVVTWGYDGTNTTFLLYIDGVALAPNVIGGTVVTNSTDLWMASYDNIAEYYNGTVAEPAIFNYALSAANVAALYNAGANPPKQAGGGWRAWWAVDE
jgi:hypothetical protein